MRTMLPRQDVPIAGDARTSNSFYAFLQDMERAVNSGADGAAGLAGQVEAIARALGSPDGTVGGIPDQSAGGGQILGTQSVQAFGSLPNPVKLALDGDTLSPGPTSLYGTDAEGVKGWRTLAEALGECSTGDLPEGANLYFTNERAATAAPIQSIVAGANVTVDVTDPRNPKIAATGGGGAMPAGYIDGLRMVWVSGTALSVTSGAAYVEGAGGVLAAPATIAKAGLSLSASTWYHVYLFDNAGTPDVEIVTTAPAAPYNGVARSKVGDASRRYLGSIKTAASGGILKFAQDGTIVTYLENIVAAPLYIVAGGTSVVPAILDLSGAVPLTSRLANTFLQNSGTQAVRFSNPDANYTLSNTTCAAFALPGSALSMPLPTDSVQQVNYKFHSTTTGGLHVFISGYVYER